MENYNLNNDRDREDLNEINYLDELFNESIESRDPITPSCLDELVRETLSASYGDAEPKRSAKTDAIYWTKTSTNPDKYETASYAINHHKDSGVWSFKYRQLDSSIIDNETGWASLLSEYRFAWDNTSVLESSIVEKFIPQYTEKEVESVSNIISFHFVDQDQLGDDLYDRLEAGRDPSLITPYSETNAIFQDDIDAIMSHIQRISSAESKGWKDYDEMPELLYRHMGELVDEMLKNRDNKGGII